MKVAKNITVHLICISYLIVKIHQGEKKKYKIITDSEPVARARGRTEREAASSSAKVDVAFCHTFPDDIPSKDRESFTFDCYSSFLIANSP